jgi:MFS family permease
MSFLMSPTPLAMRDGGYSFDTVSHVIMSHMLGMYAPSFVTGGAVAKYGWKTIAAAGSLLFVVASLVMHDGVSLAHYVGGQLALGVAWNLCFVASSVEVARVSLATSRLAGGADEEKAKSAQKVQSAADVLTFAFAGAASVGSGAALARINWKGMQVVGWICACLMMLAVAVGALRSQDAPREKDGVLLKGALEGQGQGEEEKAGADERV